MTEPERFATCPFCGSGEVGFGGSGDDGPNYMVCLKCRAEGPYSSGPDEAVKKWDQRFDTIDKGLDALIVARLREWMKAHYGECPRWLANTDERPLEQTITMCLSACLSSGDVTKKTHECDHAER